MINYYSILQVEENATQDEIKAAYHKMARLFHPDNFKGSQDEAAEQMAKINEAYQILSDINKRAVYDADRKLESGKSDYDNNDKYDMHERSNPFSESVKTNAANTDNVTKPSNKGCSSCLAKIIEWAIYIGILYAVINHFNLVDKAKDLLNIINLAQYSSEEGNLPKLANLKPEEVVEYYFKYIKKGENEEANELFGMDADKNFQTCTVAEYNKVITDLYYGFEKDIPTYPLFEEIRNFNYAVSSVNIDEKEESAEVNIEIENCDVALLFGLILADDSDENILETLSDSELQELFRNAIKKYKDACMISTNATFILKKTQEGYWEIDSISPLKDFSTVIIGQADDLVLTLNGENVDDDVMDENEDYDEDYDEGAGLLW